MDKVIISWPQAMGLRRQMFNGTTTAKLAVEGLYNLLQIISFAFKQLRGVIKNTRLILNDVEIICIHLIL